MIEPDFYLRVCGNASLHLCLRLYIRAFEFQILLQRVDCLASAGLAPFTSHLGRHTRSDTSGNGYRSFCGSGQFCHQVSSYRYINRYGSNHKGISGLYYIFQKSKFLAHLCACSSGDFEDQFHIESAFEIYAQILKVSYSYIFPRHFTEIEFKYTLKPNVKITFIPRQT